MFIVPSTIASAVRFPLGMRAGVLGPRPHQQLVLYEFEACPFCRKVREALTILDLDVLVRPTPHGGTRFRPEAIALGGKSQFPLLIDPNFDLKLYESDDIIEHLFVHYGAGKAPFGLRMGMFGNAMSGLASSVSFMEPPDIPRPLPAASPRPGCWSTPPDGCATFWRCAGHGRRRDRRRRRQGPRR